MQPGASFTVTGADFDCSADEGRAGPLTLAVSGQQPVDLTADDSGSFTGSVTVPSDASPGTYRLAARCTAVDGAPVAEGTFEVAARRLRDPSISPAPGSGPPRTRFTVTGEDFRCAGGAGVDIRWDGEPVANGTPGEDGTFTVTLSVPDSADEGEHEVTAACVSPGAVRAVTRFTVDPPAVSPPPEDGHDVTIHLTRYPAQCTRGAIVIGGRRLDTWLDEGSLEGDAGAGRWEFIDLHAHIPGDMRGHREVDLDCRGRAREEAGEITLPPVEQLTMFALPGGSTPPPEGKTGEVVPSPPHGGTGGGSARRPRAGGGPPPPPPPPARRRPPPP
ncbi:hypothetical protein ACFW2E_14970, partial [Streptomyces sp. NPDC058964]